MNLSKKTSQKLWQLHGCLTILEYPKKPTFDEIIFTAAKNYLSLIEEDANAEAYKTLGFHVKIEKGES